MTLQELENILRSRPDSPLFARLAHEYLIENRIEEAKNLILKSIDHYSEYSTAYFALAECYLQEQNIIAAFDAINKAIEINPSVITLQKVREEIQSLSESNASYVSETEHQTEETIQTVSVPVDMSVNDSIPLPEQVELTLQPETTEQNEIYENETVEEAKDKGNAEIKEEFSLTESEKEDINIIPTVSSEESAISENEFSVAQINEIEQYQENKEETGELPEKPLEEESKAIDSIAQEQKEQINSEINVESKIENLTESQGTLSSEILEKPTTEPVDQIIPQLPEEIQNISSVNIQPSLESIEDTKQEEPVSKILPSMESEEESRIVSKTLAEIYATQGEHKEAIIIYQILRKQRPEMSAEIDKRIEELEKLISDNLPAQDN